ncbi:MAG TPA: hypothetical protein VIY68_06555 [Steroidobacteraceae bacterium]
MKTMTASLAQGLGLLCIMTITACNGGIVPRLPVPPPPQTFTVGGSASGLAGSGLVLQNNGGDNLSIATSGNFNFATGLASGAAFDVTVKTQPLSPTQTCIVTNPTGTIGSANITNVAVACTTNTYSIGGRVTGLTGSGLVLQDNAGNDLAVAAASSTFTFSTPIASGASYQVTVKTQPTAPTQTCAVTAATGTVVSSNITNVVVTCTTTSYTVGGSITGLTASGLVLQNNAADDLTVSATSTSFTFATAVASGAPYSVTVKTQPAGLTCAVTSGSGAVGAAPVTNVAVACTAVASFVCGVTENGTVVTHANNITASETWAGAGTVHLIPNSISILAPATVTIQKCAIVKLNASVGITVQGAASGASTAKLLAAGDDVTTGVIVFTAMDATQPWGRLRGFNPNSLIELDYAVISGGGSVGGAQRNAVIAMAGASTLPDPVLKVTNAIVTNTAGPGIYLSDAAFTSDSNGLLVQGGAGAPADIIDAPAMALGSIPPNAFGDSSGRDILVVENANIFDNLTINTNVPIHFKTDSVHVGGLAPSFVPNVTLTLNKGVTLKFERASTAPTLVGFGDIGQSPDKNAALIINGTTDAPVLLTSAVLPTPAPGDWAGLWLITSVGSQLNNVIIEYAGGDAGVGPLSCGPVDPTTHSPYRHTAALLVGDGNDLQYAPPAGLVTNGTFRNNAGNFAIDSVWQSAAFGPSLNATNTFTNSAKVCTQSKNYITGGCVVAGVDQSGCLVQ